MQKSLTDTQRQSGLKALLSLNRWFTRWEELSSNSNLPAYRKRKIFIWIAGWGDLILSVQREEISTKMIIKERPWTDFEGYHKRTENLVIFFCCSFRSCQGSHKPYYLEVLQGCKVTLYTTYCQHIWILSKLLKYTTGHKRIESGTRWYCYKTR